MTAEQILARIEPLLDERLVAWQEDLALLVKQASVRDLATVSEDAPFGSGVRAAFDAFARIAQKLSFAVTDFSGYAIDARLTDADHSIDYVAVLGHLDVVAAGSPADWQSEPFTLTQRDGYLYGRGVNDDKGPLLLCLYAASLLKEIGFPFHVPLRIIAGGAEETTWECVNHYFRVNPQPLTAFSPDGNFPIVTHELGMLDLTLTFQPMEQDVLYTENSMPLLKLASPPAEHKVCAELRLWPKETTSEEPFLTYRGKSALSRHPERGLNAIDLALPFLKVDGHAMLEFYKMFCYADGEASTKKLLGLLTAAPPDAQLFTQTATSIEYDADVATLTLDLRYPHGFPVETFLSALQAALYGASFTVERHLKPLYVDPFSPLVQDLSAAYECVMGHPLGATGAKGAASYARALSNGVSFGPTFPDEEPGSHFPNERFSLASARKLLKIYAVSIAKLCGENVHGIFSA